MKTLYIDSEFKVHTEYSSGMTAIETDVFDDLPKQVIECYIFVPCGKSYVKSNGMTVYGEFIQPFVTQERLDEAQAIYEREQYRVLAEENAALVVALDELDAEYQKGVDSL